MPEGYCLWDFCNPCGEYILDIEKVATGCKFRKMGGCGNYLYRRWHTLLPQ